MYPISPFLFILEIDDAIEHALGGAQEVVVELVNREKLRDPNDLVCLFDCAEDALDTRGLCLDVLDLENLKYRYTTGRQ